MQKEQEIFALAREVRRCIHNLDFEKAIPLRDRYVELQQGMNNEGDLMAQCRETGEKLQQYRAELKRAKDDVKNCNSEMRRLASQMQYEEAIEMREKWKALLEVLPALEESILSNISVVESENLRIQTEIMQVRVRLDELQSDIRIAVQNHDKDRVALLREEQNRLNSRLQRRKLPLLL